MWRIGIDEAGYGPNFGPLVMTAAMCQTPNGEDPWTLLHPVVDRVGKKKDASDAIRIDDSKKVFQTSKGLAELERAALACLAGDDIACQTLADLLGRLQAEAIDEPWYHGRTKLPQTCCPDRLARSKSSLHARMTERDVRWGAFTSVVVGAPRFNAIVDRAGSKGAVLATGLVHLLRRCLDTLPAGEATVVVDKHGGRNFYGPLLQEVSPDLWVTPIEEGMVSSYQMQGDGRTIRITFRPEADATSFEVALASIISKYVRELCMDEFNEFWRTHVPGVKPTAGYPGDAIRFRKDIQEASARIGVPLDRIWRSR